MHTSVRSSLSVGAAFAVAGAVVAAPPPPVPVPAPVVANIRLAADPVPIGGLVTSFLGNQLIYCSIICPDVVKLVATVPLGAVAAPAVFVTTLASGNPLKALGAAVASVTNPLNAAFDPIITNDLNLVLPRAQNALEVGVVGLLNIATAGPLDVVNAIQTARQNTFDALNDTIPPSRTAPNPRGLIQVVAVEAINIASSIAFQAFEEGLLGIVQTVDAAATTLAQTGDPIAAFVAGEKAAFASFGKTLGYIATASHNAVVNIAAALHDPMPARDLTTSADDTAALAAITTGPTVKMHGRGQNADKSLVSGQSRDELVKKDKPVDATKANKRDAAKTLGREAFAKIRHSLKGRDNSTTKSVTNTQDKAKGDADNTADGKAKTTGGKDHTPKAKQHHKKQHTSADATSG